MSNAGDRAQGARTALKRCGWATLISDPVQVPGADVVLPVYDNYHPLPLVRDCNVTDNDSTTTEYFDDMAAFVLYSPGDKTITVNRAYINNEDAVHVLGAKKAKGGAGYLDGKVKPYGAFFGQRGFVTPDGETGFELFVYLKVQAGGGANNAATRQQTPALQLRTLNFTAISRLCDEQSVYCETYMDNELTPEILNRFFSVETVNKLYEEVTGTVTGVEVSPEEVDVAPGGTQAFTAEVTGEDDYDETVKWSVAGAKKAGTVINDGVLTVAADETASIIVVTAASVQDDSKSGAAVVTVTE